MGGYSKASEPRLPRAVSECRRLMHPYITQRGPDCCGCHYCPGFRYLRGARVRKEIEGFHHHLPKTLLCLTLSPWFLVASGRSPTAGEAGAVNLSPPRHGSAPRLEGGKVGTQPLRSVVLHPHSMVVLPQAGPALEGHIWRSVGRLQGSSRRLLFSAQMVLQIFHPPPLEAVAAGKPALSLSNALLSFPQSPTTTKQCLF